VRWRASAARRDFELELSATSTSASVRVWVAESSCALVELAFAFVFGGVDDAFASARGPTLGRLFSRVFADVEGAFASEGTSDLPRRLALAPVRVGGALERCFRSLIEEFLASGRTLLA
jgi:hypothetical protein